VFQPPPPCPGERLFPSRFFHFSRGTSTLFFVFVGPFDPIHSGTDFTCPPLPCLLFFFVFFLCCPVLPPFPFPARYCLWPVFFVQRIVVRSPISSITFLFLFSRPHFFLHPRHFSCTPGTPGPHHFRWPACPYKKATPRIPLLPNPKLVFFSSLVPGPVCHFHVEDPTLSFMLTSLPLLICFFFLPVHFRSTDPFP